MPRPLTPLDSQPAPQDPAPAPATAPAEPKPPESPLASQLPSWDLLPPTTFIRRRGAP